MNTTFKTHELKCLTSFFGEVLSGLKTFEIRQNDRGYAVGDMLRLKEWNNVDYTGREALCLVTYLTDFAQQPGWVVMAIRPVPEELPEDSKPLNEVLSRVRQDLKGKVEIEPKADEILERTKR